MNELQPISEIDFREVALTLDGSSYDRCTFDRCVLTYYGLGLVNISGCTFNACQFKLDGPAANTMALLTSVYQIGFGGAGLVESFFAAIRSGAMNTESAPLPEPTNEVEQHWLH